MAKKNSKSEYYLGNPNLPNKHWKEEYTLEMVNDLKQCKEDLLYFAENFFYIIDPDKGKVQIELFEYQKKALNTLLNNRQVILLASRQVGKALALDTPIPIPTGWTTIGEIKDNDEVYGIDGKICKVSKAHDILINRPCYEVEFDNGEKIIADEEHLWFTQTRSERYLKISGTKKSTKQILKTLLTNSKTRQEPNHRIPANINGIETLNAQLPINPYILGLWLGDGTAATGTITVGTRDIEEIVDILSKQQQFDKLILHEYNKDVYTLRITNADNPKLNSLSTLLRNCDLINNKHIPEIYMRSSREQRIELLRGLIDSDGYISKQRGIAQFYNTNLILINHVRELIESLGYKVTQKTFIPKLKGVECTEVGVLTFTPIEYVCKLSFKTASIKCKEFINNTKLRSQWHYIKAITPIESVPVRCITVDNDTGTFLCGRQFIPTSNTTLLTIYALWIACFNEYQNIIIVANKESTAIEIFRRVRLAYEEMPNWAKSPAREYGKTSLELENGSRIGISTTTGSAARGASINTLIIDEMAFIEPESILQDFWRSVFPTISRSKKSKVLIASTPNGTGNLFHTLFDGAEKKENEFVYERVLWSAIPGRDEEWKQKQIRALGSTESFLQEYETVFLATGDSSLDEELFYKLSQNCKPAPIILDEGHYKIWEEPDAARIYVAGVDIAEGVGMDASVIQILDITDLAQIKQVAVYHNNTIAPLEFTNKLYGILRNWGSPIALIERNNCGAQVVDRLVFDMGYEKVVSYGAKVAGRNRAQMGMIAHTNTKYKGILNMRYFLNEVKCIEFNDIDTLKELKDFVRQPNGTWRARGTAHDDRVMSLMYALYILERELTERFFEIIELDERGKPKDIRPMDFGVSLFEKPTSIYLDNEITSIGGNTTQAVVFGMDDEREGDDLFDLQRNGWSLL